MVVQELADLSRNEAYLKMSVEELNRGLEQKIEPLETEADKIKERLKEIDQEVGRYVKALGQGRLSIGRLEAEISRLEPDKQPLQKQYDDLQDRIHEAAMRDYNAEVLQRTLQDFRSVFGSLTPQEQSEALQCGVKSVVVHPRKLDLEIFELPEFCLGLRNRKEWLRGGDYVPLREHILRQGKHSNQQQSQKEIEGASEILLVAGTTGLC